MTAEKGNIIWFLLVAIALLGLLTVMLSRSSSTSNETGNYEQNVIAINEILSYAKSIENAVQSLLARGCGENEISIQEDWNEDGVISNNAADRYNNQQRADKSCNVYDANGAGLYFFKNYSFIDESEYMKDHRLSGWVGVSGFGAEDKAELLYLFRLNPTEDNLKLCNNFNKVLGLPSDIADALNAQFLYYFRNTGEYRDGLGVAGIIGDQAGTVLKGKATGCFNATGYDAGGYLFYHVVHAR